jgi:hypothetical protein
VLIDVRIQRAKGQNGLSGPALDSGSKDRGLH